MRMSLGWILPVALAIIGPAGASAQGGAIAGRVFLDTNRPARRSIASAGAS